MRLYPAIGTVVEDEGGITIPASGVVIDELTDYYLELLRKGLLLTSDPSEA